MLPFRQFISRLKRKNGALFKRLLLLGTCLMAIYLICSISIFSTSYSVLSDDDILEIGARKAMRVSAFHWIEKRQKKVIGQVSEKRGKLFRFPFLSSNRSEDAETELLLNWKSSPIAEKCRYMIDATYALNRAWTNEHILKFYGEDEVDNVLISLMAERQRMFDYCFLSSNLSLEDVFKVESLIGLKYEIRSSPNDFLRRMFPFLKKLDDQGDQVLWPQITNLRSGSIQAIPDLPENFNQNFFSNWQRMASGSGIVITLNEGSKNLLYKQLKVFDHSDNTLPIQIITTGNDFSDGFIEELKAKVAASKQNVYLVDCSPILDSEFAKEHIGDIINKWIAVIFTTFEEAILLDVDAVPFVPMDDFLTEKSYKTSGILMYKDRSMPNEHTFQYCIDMLREVEPSYQERHLINSRIKYHSGTKDFEQSEEADVYKRFSHDLLLHHVESGLVVINKPKKLGGLLLSFLLQLDAKMKRCVYGDKEIFWLGQLYAGQDYSIYPTDGGVAGPLIVEKHDSVSVYQICATQIAHIDESHNLLWTNGGLKTCKFDNGAEADFERNPAYFEQRYQELESLKSIYGSPLNIEGTIIPNINEKPWLQINECESYMYCASAYKDNNNASPEVGELSVFDETTSNRIKSIVSIWNQS